MKCNRRAAVAALVGGIPLSAWSVVKGPGFVPSLSVEAWRNFLSSRGLRTETLSPASLVQTSLDFFSLVGVNGLAANSQADMLLYQWGIFDFGKGEFFEFDLTRQFLAAGRSGDDAISQFRCTAYFAPTTALRGLSQGNRWCHSKAEVAAFKEYILQSDVFAAVKHDVPQRVAAEWGRV